MKQVSCDPAPLCQGDMLNRKVRLDVIPFLSSPHLSINFCLLSSWLYQAGLILAQMLQDQSQLACGVFHFGFFTSGLSLCVPLQEGTS